MGKAFKITLMVCVVILVAGGLVFAGALIGHRTSLSLGEPQASYRMMNSWNVPDGRNGQASQIGGTGPGMMNGSGGSGSGMMNGWNVPGGSIGRGMMNGYGSANSSAAPLTIEQAYQAATSYLVTLNNSDLKIAEVMVFDNNAYVRIIEQSTGTGAFELLVNPSTLAVTPEPGPNMMWNLKYGAMNHSNMMGSGNGMMGNSTSSAAPAAIYPTMTVSTAQALQAAQQYLDAALPGTKTAADADPFYGYYTIDILRDGNIIGMLSVNGFDSQVFLHTWHGTFIATQDY